MTDWLKAAQRATTPEHKRKFMRRHREQALRDSIRSCRNCPLNRGRKNAVPWDGDAPKPIAIVGEAPGANEDKQGIPFVGRAGNMLEKLMSPYVRADAIIMNIVCCRPPKNRTPTKDEVEACRPNYVAQLAASGAWTVVLLGNSALKSRRPGTRISEMRGKPFWEEGRIWVPTYHPAYVLRNRDAIAETSKDLRLAFDIAYGKAWIPPEITKSLVGPLAGALIDPDPAAIRSDLAGQGWSRIYSPRLEDIVVVVNSSDVVLPKAEREFVTYTVQEMVRLGEFAAGNRLQKDQLRAVHYVKSIGGTVVA